MKIKIKPRKVVGYSYSLLTTLPKIWVDGMNIKKGDLINMYIDGDKLILKVNKNGK